MKDMWQTDNPILPGFLDDKDTKDQRRGKELSLAAFEGKCHKCCKFGHMARDCKSGGKGGKSDGKKSKGKFNGTCHQCGKSGHKKEDCWQRECNKNKHPDWYSPSEHANAAVNEDNSRNEGTDIELMLMGINEEFKNN